MFAESQIRTRRRAQVTLALGALLLSLPIDAAAAGLVGSRTRSQTAGDFDGDGLIDRAFGFPQVDFGSGSVVVVYGNGRAEEWNRDSAGVGSSSAASDFFGDSVAAGDIDGDGLDDLVVGVPGDYTWPSSNAGSIHVLYGSSSGITADFDQIISQGSVGVDGQVESNDNFGESVVVADFDCDGYADIAVGTPLDDAHTNRTDDGSVNVIFGSSGGATSVDDYFHQGVGGVSGAPESGDQFGAALAAGNFNGDTSGGRACMDLAIGVVGENSAQGYAVFFYGDPSAGFSYTTKTGLNQKTSGVVDAAEAGDAFGAQFWTIDYDGNSWEDLVVGVPGEECLDGTTGGLHRFRGHASGFVVGNVVQNTSNSLQCVEWDGAAAAAASTSYAGCMQIAGASCGEELESAWIASGLGPAKVPVATCSVAAEFALDACEHWITDPDCDLELCISSALEMSRIGDACYFTGDVLTHAL